MTHSTPAFLRALRVWLLMAFAALAGLAQATEPRVSSDVATPEVHARLLVDGPGYQPGSPLEVGVELTPTPGWHTYWRNPGTTGQPTRLDWRLPPGLSADGILWAVPERFASSGGQVGYGYTRATLHRARIAVPAGFAGPLPLDVTAHWLACRDICVPGEARLGLSVPPLPARPHSSPADAAAADPVASLFAEARAAAPTAIETPGSWQTTGREATFSVTLPGDAMTTARLSDLSFFPYRQRLTEASAPQAVSVASDADGSRVWITQASTDTAGNPERGVLVAHTAAGTTAAYVAEFQPGVVPVRPTGARRLFQAATPAAEAAPPGRPKTATGLATGALSAALVAAFLGGLILNLMPCVFPVLSLKALAVARAGNPTARRREALAYTAGVMVTTLLLAGGLLALRASGRGAGWGFQLQEPLFVAGLTVFLLVLGLSMSGVAEPGGRFQGVGQSLVEGGGLRGAFFTGVLAIVAATPCTAPFMGAALGFAVGQPVPVALLVFAMLGLGMSLPFLALGFVPGAARFLPRPGAWMSTFKQLLAFPLYATAAWLLWVLARQAGPDALAATLAALVAAALATWLWGLPNARSTTRALAVAAGLAVVGLLWPLRSLDHMPPKKAGATTGQGALAATAENAGHDGSEPYSDARLKALQAEHRIVFVNLTADWCLTCKVNERTTLGTDTVQAAFKQRRVAYLVGDWTQSDPAITHVLERFGRVGVPLYIIFRPGAEPIVLSQVLTTDEVLHALSGENS